MNVYLANKLLCDLIDETLFLAKNNIKYRFRFIVGEMTFIKFLYNLFRYIKLTNLISENIKIFYFKEITVFN